MTALTFEDNETKWRSKYGNVFCTSFKLGGVTPIKPSVMLASLSCLYKRTRCGHFAGIVKMLKANALSVVEQSVTRRCDAGSHHSEVQAAAFCMTCDCETGQNRTSFVSLSPSPPQRSRRGSRLHYTYISELFLFFFLKREKTTNKEQLVKQ